MKKPFRADDALAQQAIACLDHIATRSELAELWEHESTWRRGLAGLKTRLASPAKEPKYRVPASKSASGFKAARTLVEKELSGRLSTPRGAEMYLRFHGNLTDEQFFRLLDLHVEVLQPIQTLELRFKGISDRTLEKLHLLPNLAVLYLLGSSVTDAGMPFLRNLPNLRKLELDTTNMSDKGLLELAESPKLLCLAVGKTKVTPKGIDALRKKKPDCFVGPTWEGFATIPRSRRRSPFRKRTTRVRTEPRGFLPHPEISVTNTLTLSSSNLVAAFQSSDEMLAEAMAVSGRITPWERTEKTTEAWSKCPTARHPSML